MFFLKMHGEFSLNQVNMVVDFTISDIFKLLLDLLSKNYACNPVISINSEINQMINELIKAAELERAVVI